MKKSFLVIVMALFASTAFSQSSDEALRYTRHSFLGSTARSTSMAGAFGALGGDFSSLSLNPAGLAVYRSVEFSITPSIYNATSESRYLDKLSRSSKSQFNIGNFGLVLPVDAGAEASSVGFKMFHFGIGVNRLNNYHRNIGFSAYNGETSITTGWVDYLNDANQSFVFDEEGNPILRGLDPYSTALAWDTWLLDWATDDAGNPYIFSDMYGGQVDQDVVLYSIGAMDEFTMSGGFNWNDMVFVGATLGVPYFNYEERYIMKEGDATEYGHPYFSNMDYRTRLNTEGTGVNFKIGAIFKPIHAVRIGLAYHTPTSFSMEDEYSATMNTHIDLNGTYHYESYFSESPYFYNEYKLVTPSRFIASLGFVLGQFATISADYERVNYAGMRYVNHEDPSAFSEVNTIIKDSYTAGNNIRVGAELALNVFRLRGGYAYSSSPYINDDNGAQHIYSLGAGLRFSSFYLDFGYARINSNMTINPYSNNYASYVKAATVENSGDQYQLTFGFRF